MVTVESLSSGEIPSTFIGNQSCRSRHVMAETKGGVGNPLSSTMKNSQNRSMRIRKSPDHALCVTYGVCPGSTEGLWNESVKHSTALRTSDVDS